MFAEAHGPRQTNLTQLPRGQDGFDFTSMEAAVRPEALVLVSEVDGALEAALSYEPPAPALTRAEALAVVDADLPEQRRLELVSAVSRIDARVGAMWRKAIAAEKTAI